MIVDQRARSVHAARTRTGTGDIAPRQQDARWGLPSITHPFVTEAASPEVYAERLATRLYPVVLPYRLGTPAAFTHARFNGRALGDDVMDVMLTLMTNTPFGEGVRPDTGSFLEDFPYLGVPTSSEHTSS